MESISQRIDGIIAARKQRQAFVEAALAKVKESERRMEDFKAARDNLDLGQAGMAEEAIGRIQALSSDGYEKALADVKEELERLKARYGREKIHISFVGRAGQGKSLALQRISGLSGSVIPSAAGSDCTGAKSIITNDEDAQKPYADITFFTEDEMVGIVNAYLESIFGDRSRNIASLRQAKKLSDTLDKPGISNTKDPTKRELRKYLDHMDELRPMLGKSKFRVEEEGIEEYVAMYKSTDPSIKYYKYLAVKGADIHCAFPKRDAGKIILVDTIGMGSQSLGVGDSLMHTVKNDSDAIIYMKRPEPLRDHWGTEDTDIVNPIVKSIGENCTRMTMYCVLNHVKAKAGNSRIIDTVRAEIPGNLFADVLKVDCSDEAEVEGKLLTPVLETISRNLSEIDEEYFKKAMGMMESLHEEYHAICGQLEKAKVSDSFARHNRDLIRNTFQTGLQNEIRDLYKRQYKLVGDQSVVMMGKVDEILKELHSLAPSKQEIIDYLKRNKHPIDAYIYAMDIMRVRIINSFLTLDIVLLKETDKAKEDVIRIFTDPAKGNLGNVFPYEEGCKPSKWINGFIEKNHGEEGFELLEPAFKALERYSLKVEGFLMHEIRLSLAPIDPSLQEMHNELPTMMGGTYEEIAECIVDYLKDALFDLRQAIRKKMARYDKIVNQANFAAIWDFHDRISYPEGGNDNAVNDAWEALYERWCEGIWPSEAAGYNDIRNGAVEWNNAIGRLKEYDNERNFGMR